MRPIVLSIGGSDCSGGAGIQADLKAIEACGGFAATALTAVTVQNGFGVTRTYVLPQDLVEAQIAAVVADARVAAVKTGMLATADTVEAVARAIARHELAPCVVDPVLAAESGGELLEPAALEPLRELLLPLATLLTPNVPEAEALSGLTIRTVADAERAGARLVACGARAVLVKGGHLDAAPATDVLVTAGGARVLRGKYEPARHTRGTGCILASAVAARLALGEDLEAAVSHARALVAGAIRHGLPMGRGRGPADPLHALAPAGLEQP